MAEFRVHPNAPTNSRQTKQTGKIQRLSNKKWHRTLCHCIVYPMSGSLCRKLALTSVRRCEPIDFIAEQLQGFLSHRYKRVMQIATPWLIRLLMDQQQVDHFPLT